MQHRQDHPGGEHHHQVGLGEIDGSTDERAHGMELELPQGVDSVSFSRHCHILCPRDRHAGDPSVSLSRPMMPVRGPSGARHSIHRPHPQATRTTKATPARYATACPTTTRWPPPPPMPTPAPHPPASRYQAPKTRNHPRRRIVPATGHPALAGAARPAGGHRRNRRRVRLRSSVCPRASCLAVRRLFASGGCEGCQERLSPAVPWRASPSRSFMSAAGVPQTS